jgi:eukaryotic-like serine/threonine-protein kinase
MTSASVSASDPSSAVAAAHERIAYARWAADMHQVRLVGTLGAAMWLGVGLLLLVLTFPDLGHGSSTAALLALLAPVPFHIGVLVIARREPFMPERIFVPIGAANFLVTGIALTFLAVRTGGLASPYHFVNLLLLLTQVLALPRPWKEGFVVALGTAAICPIGVLVASRWDPIVRAQLDDPVAVSYFVAVILILAAAVVIRSWGGHVMWSLRQSAFETKSIGRYRLRRRIGKGGMGEVWRARDKAIRRDVALKILSPEHGRSPSSIARFEREIEATAALEHPSIVRVHDWGVTHDGVWYYAMELLAGCDLTTLVETRGRLPAPQVARLGAQAARAIGEAHRRGIVHRDLKPSNLFCVIVDGIVDHVKVLDFGIARVGDDNVTQTGAVVGTPGYIAPEVLAGGEAATSADVWALGATLFFAVTGTKLRDAKGASAIELAPDIPRALDEILLLALSADPASRPTTAGDLADALDATGLAATCQPLHMELTPMTSESLTEQPTLAEGPAARDRRASS